jgi:hypothetical protein
MQTVVLVILQKKFLLMAVMKRKIAEKWGGGMHYCNNIALKSL